MSLAKGIASYRGLFAGHIDEVDLHSIRKGIEAGGVVGNDHFRKEIEVTIDRRVMRYPHGGDRKSE